MNTDAPQLLLASFLGAFSRLDLDGMLEGFAAEATAFFPVEHERLRLDGKDAIRAAFAAVLTRLRASGATSLPLEAEDLRLQEWGDTAVASFYVRDEQLCRRTLALRREAGCWRIVHLHASNAPRAG